MTQPLLISEWPKNERESVRVTIEEFNGRSIINARIWFRADDGEMRPGKAGIAMGVKHLPALAQAFAEAEAKAIEQGMIELEAPHV